MTTAEENSLWPSVLKRLRLDWRAVLTTHLFFTGLGIVVFAPLISLLGRLLLSFSDQPALADQDIARFLLSPVGIIGLIVVAALLIAILAFEQAAMMALGAARLQGLYPGTLGALRLTGARAGTITAFALRLVVRVLILTLPFLTAAAAVAWFLLTDYDINYYLTERPSAFWLAAAAIGLLLIPMLLLLASRLLAWSMSLSLVLFADLDAKYAFAESARFVAGHRRELIRALLVWGVLALLLGAVVVAVVQRLGAWVVPQFFDSIAWLVPVLGAFVILWMLGNFIATAFTNSSLAYMLASFYDKHATGELRAVLNQDSRQHPARGPSVSAPALATLLAGAAVAAVLVGGWLLNGIQIRDQATVVAHRGAAGKAPENTLASIRQAIADGADWVEIDVQESADGEVVVIHDSDFMKLARIDLKVWNGTLAELKA
ncbi:MAG: glycerophosphodiester phosphodiesterase family protein, partial [Halieaceae bacterium]|nr:glycerophosphodiester phosphodiesterase family protein [Halieaceae bacterium]